METIYFYKSITKVDGNTHTIGVYSFRKLDRRKLSNNPPSPSSRWNPELLKLSFEEFLIPTSSWKVEGVETPLLIKLKELDENREFLFAYTVYNRSDVVISSMQWELETSHYAPTYLLNAFSIQMLDEPYLKEINVAFQELEDDEVPSHDGLLSAIGHPDTAAVLGVECNRIDVKLRSGDTAYVAQLMGGRLPEGSTVLPDGYRFKFFKVKIL